MDEKETNSKMQKKPNQKRNLAIVTSSFAAILVLTILGAALGNLNASNSKQSPSFVWDTQEEGAYDKERKLLSRQVFVMKEENEKPWISSVFLPKDAAYLLFPRIDNNKARIQGIKGQDSTIVHSDFELTLKGIYFASSYITIGMNSFRNLPSLEEVRFGSDKNETTSIEERAFADNKNLSTVVFSKNITKIGDSCFENNEKLRKINLENRQIYQIGKAAFKGCLALEEVIIPNSLTSISPSLFEGCSSLSSLKYQGSSGSWEALSKGDKWREGSSLKEIVCKDKTIVL